MTWSIKKEGSLYKMEKKLGLDHTRGFEAMPINVINMNAIGSHPRVLFRGRGWRSERQVDVGRPVRHCCISSDNSLVIEVGDSKRDRKKQQFQEIFRKLNQPNLLTYIAFGGIRKREKGGERGD